MRRIKVYVETDLIGSKVTDVIEVEDDLTEKEIENEVREWMFDHIQWGWEKAKG